MIISRQLQKYQGAADRKCTVQLWGILQTLDAPRGYFVIVKTIACKRISELVKLIATTPTGEYPNRKSYNGISLMNDTAEKSASLEKVTFEDALQELEGIVASLERGEVSLDDAIAAFERGTQLKSHCQARLEEARMKVEKIKVPGAGTAPASVSNFDMGQS